MSTRVLTHLGSPHKVRREILATVTPPVSAEFRDDSRRQVLTPGTRVLILGAYPFGTPPAWLSLDALSTPVTLPSGDVFSPVRDKSLRQ